MNRTFTIHDSVIIQYQGLDLDIHNSYCLMSIKRARDDCDFSMSFRKEKGDWVNTDDPSEFIICFQGLSVLEYNFDTENVKTEIDEIGFKSPSDTDTDYDWLLPEAQADSTDRIIFRFMDDGILRVFAENVSIQLKFIGVL